MLAYPISSSQPVKSNRFICLTYFNDDKLSKQLHNILKNYNLHLSFKSYNIQKEICNFKLDKPDFLNRSGVYRIDCNNCNSAYIGETGRALKTRLREHRKDFIKSRMGLHIAETRHDFSTDNVKLLHSTNKGLLQNTYEILEIEKLNLDPDFICLNDKLSLKYYPLFKLLEPTLKLYGG